MTDLSKGLLQLGGQRTFCTALLSKGLLQLGEQRTFCTALEDVDGAMSLSMTSAISPS